MIAELESLRFFRDLSHKQLDVLSEKASVLRFKAGDTIFDEDRMEKFIGYIIEGKGSFIFTGRDGIEYRMESYQNAPIGAIFLDGYSPPGALVADTDVKILGWRLPDIEQIEKDYPPLGLTFYKAISFYLIQNVRRLICNH